MNIGKTYIGRKIRTKCRTAYLVLKKRFGLINNNERAELIRIRAHKKYLKSRKRTVKSTERFFLKQITDQCITEPVFEKSVRIWSSEYHLEHVAHRALFRKYKGIITEWRKEPYMDVLNRERTGHYVYYYTVDLRPKHK